MWSVELIEATRVKRLSHTDEGAAKNCKSKQSRQGEEWGYKVEADQEGILDVVWKRQEKWKNRLEEMNDDRTTKKVFKGELEGMRPRSREVEVE